MRKFINSLRSNNKLLTAFGLGLLFQNTAQRDFWCGWVVSCYFLFFFVGLGLLGFGGEGLGFEGFTFLCSVDSCFSLLFFLLFFLFSYLWDWGYWVLAGWVWFLRVVG
jgi:hypothetical protein